MKLQIQTNQIKHIIIEDEYCLENQRKTFWGTDDDDKICK